MKKIKKALLIALFAVPTLGLACSGEWYTCGNLSTFLVQLAQNCPNSGSVIINDCDAGRFRVNYSVA